SPVAVFVKSGDRSAQTVRAPAVPGGRFPELFTGSARTVIGTRTNGPANGGAFMLRVLQRGSSPAAPDPMPARLRAGRLAPTRPAPGPPRGEPPGPARESLARGRWH